MSETLQERAQTARQAAWEKHRQRAEEDRLTARQQLEDRFSIALCRVLNLPNTQVGSWGEDRKKWPGEWVSVPPPEGETGLGELRYTQDGLTFVPHRDSFNKVLLLVVCPNCDRPRGVEVDDLVNLGGWLVKPKADLPLCWECEEIRQEEDRARWVASAPADEVRMMDASTKLLFALKEFIEETVDRNE